MSRAGRLVALRAARSLIEGEERHGWWVVLRGETVEAVQRSRPAGAECHELVGMDLIPGLVDLHSDCLEQKTRPRPGMEIPTAAGILELDSEAAALGITTHFLCVGLDNDPEHRRSLEIADETLGTLARMRPELRIDHRVHLRVEMTGDGPTMAAALAGRPPVSLLSYMVHVPGTGQFRSEASWLGYYTRHGPSQNAQQVIAFRKSRLGLVGERRRTLAALAGEHGLVLASHDDDSTGVVEVAVSLGVRIAEFPVNEEAAEAAVSRGLGTVMGAPNARRGASQHEGNLSARRALSRGLLTALASDYHPASLLASAYQLAADRVCSWSQAVALVSTNPARLAGLADRASIEPGKRADLVAVGPRAGLPAVAQTWVAGRPVFEAG